MATRFFLLVILICGVFPDSAHATNWYVDNAASGVNNGTRWTDAWQSFAAINWNNIQPGDTVYISGGSTSKTYYETLTVEASGEIDNLITIRPGQDTGRNGIVIIDGEDTRMWGVYTQGKDYILVYGLEIKDATGCCLLVNWDGDHGYGIQIINNTVHGSGGAGIYYRHCKNGLIEGNHIYDNEGDGIGMLEVDDGLIIRGNTIHDGNEDGIKGSGFGLIIVENNRIYNMQSTINHGDGIQYIGNADTLIIRNNYWADNTMNIYVDGGPSASVLDKVFIYNNLVVNTDPGEDGTSGWYNGIAIETGYGISHTNELYIFGNTLINLNAGVGGIGTTGDIRTLIVKNNIFYNSINQIDMHSNYTLLEIDYNVYYNQYRSEWYMRDFLTLAQFKVLYPTQEQHGFYANPLFAETSQDYHLDSLSAAIDKGIALSNIGSVAFNTDKDGNVRPQGSGWDIGAYEYVSGTPKRHNQIPSRVVLGQNYPNPFNPSTAIEYQIPLRQEVKHGGQASPFSEKGERGGFVSLKVYDMLGREVATLVNEEKPAGGYQIQWNAVNIASGVYFYRLQTRQTSSGQAGVFTETKKLVLLR